MKMLVIGSDQESMENVIDLATDADITAAGKLVQEYDNSAVLKNIQDGFNRGYSSIIMIVQDHIGASIFLNRDKQIRAAPCRTIEDVRLARNNDANVLVFNKNNGFDKNCFKILKQSYDEPKNEDKKAIKTVEKYQRPNKEQQGKEIKMPIKRFEEEPEEEVEIQRPGNRNKGLFKNIKDSLGIIDE